MKNRFLCPFLIILLAFCIKTADAQRKKDRVRGLGFNGELYENVIKLNLSPIAVSTGSIQYERYLQNRKSILLGLRATPKRALPYQDVFASIPGDFANFYANTRFNSFAITPEYRKYFGRQTGRGFYIGLMGKYERYKLIAPKTFTLADLTEKQIDFKGSLNRLGLGLQLGAQAKIGKRITLDWWLLGPTGYYDQFYLGAQSADFGLAQADFDKFNATFKNQEYLSLLLDKVGVTANNNEISVEQKRFGYGVRAGFCVGYRFNVKGM